jgi:hypothetical protein
MPKVIAFLLLCVGCAYVGCAATAGENRPETFVINASHGGREATVKIPVGAVFSFSANNAQPLADSTGPQVEAMRLSGDVRISVTGTPAPIEIKADHVVLELTADETPVGMLRVQPARRLRSAQVIMGDDETQTFVGNVVFTVQTTSGALQIKADRVQRVAGSAGA